jgi:TRAP-type transport system periplasmic protein
MQKWTAFNRLLLEMQERAVSRRRLLAGSVRLGLAGSALPLLAPGRATAGASRVTLKFGYTSTPTNPVSVGYEKFAALVREKSQGELNVVTFCCNQMGNDQQLVQSVQSGALQLGTSSNNNLDQFTSETMALELPYLIKSRAVYRKFWETPVGQGLRQKMEAKLGLKILMVMDAGGFRSIETRSRPVHTPADLKGIKLRVANTPIELATFKRWGANPVPLPYNQVFTAVQQGTVDGEVLQPVWFFTDKHYEAAKQVCHIHYIMLSHIGFMNPRAFNALPRDMQGVIVAAAKEAEDFEWDYAGGATAKADAALKAVPGINWYEPSAAELNVWETTSRPVWSEFSARIGADLIRSIEALNG